jgi:eukaryotic-like serine/threonine-protein kinase
VYWVGFIARRRGEMAQAGQAFREYVAMADRMVALDPAKVEWRMEQAMAAHNLGVWYLDSNLPKEAIAQFDQARSVWTSLLPQRPELGMELAKAWGFIARGREMLSDTQGALTANEAKLQALAHVPEGRGNREVELLRGTIHYDIARLSLYVGDARRAEQASRAGVAVVEQVTQRDPANLYWGMRSAFQRLMLLEVLLAQGQRDAARALWPRTRDEAAALLRRADPGDQNRQLRLAGALLLMRQRLDADVREADFDAYLADTRRFVETGGLKDPDNRRTFCAVLIAAGDRAQAAGRTEAARHYWSDALAQLEPLAGAEAPQTFTLMAQALLRLGDLAGARALAERVAATPYRHPAQADLVQRLAAAGRGVPVTKPQ